MKNSMEGDDKALPEANKKRKVKTPAQVQALEKFYNEEKYPSDTKREQLAESLGLTEKQVSGWFCHRRLKDKRLMNGENNAVGRQDRSSGVIQDRASGHRQDSCGSTKLGEDRNFDNKEVESGRLNRQEYFAGEQTYERSGRYAANYNHVDDTSSGSSSSLRNMSHNGDPIDATSSRYLTPKFPTEVKGVKSRPGPSGYLKVKGQIENPAITAVKKQLGKHYREDGPPLGVEFDPLPPGAFESSMQDPVDETYCDDLQPASPDIPKIRQHPKFSNGYECHSSMASLSSEMDGTSFRTTKRSDASYNRIHQKFPGNASLAYNSTHHPQRKSPLQFSEGSTRAIPGSEIIDDYGMRSRHSVERVNSGSRHHYLQPYGEKIRAEGEAYHHKYNDTGTKISQGENVEKTSNFPMRGYGQHYPADRGIPRQITKDSQPYAERRMMYENPIKVPPSNNTIVPKRMRDGFPQPQHGKRSLVVDNQIGNYPVMRPTAEVPSSFSEDEEGSADTNSSMD